MMSAPCVDDPLRAGSATNTFSVTTRPPGVITEKRWRRTGVAPGTAFICSAIQLADVTSPAVPGTRSGATVAMSAAMPRAAIASKAGGSGGSGVPPGVSSVSRATSSASAATSHESR